MFFFFQAEDGIRDKLVTGVQTCALPILPVNGRKAASAAGPSRGFSRAIRSGRDVPVHDGGRIARARPEIGRASWRGRVEISVVAGSLKKKKTEDVAESTRRLTGEREHYS